MIRCNYLVPVEYNHLDNGIGDRFVNTHISGSGGSFTFSYSRTEDTGVGGYGEGGYYWRRFKIYNSDFSQNDIVWLSTWNFNSLVYG